MFPYGLRILAHVVYIVSELKHGKYKQETTAENTVYCAR